MKNFKKVLSLALAVVMVAATVLVAPVDAKAKTVTTYTKVTDVATLAAGGEFVMAVEYSGTYYTINSIDNSKKWGYAGEITATSTEIPTITVEAGSASDKVYLKFADKYIKGADANALYDDASKVALTEWQVVENGTDTFQFKLIGSKDARSLGFNPNKGTPGFRAYKDSVLTGTTASGYAYNFEIYAIGTEEAPMTIAEALATEVGTQCKVKGVVTLADGKNVYIQDATGGICAYMATAPTDIQLGDTIEVEGSFKLYNNLPELDQATYTKSSGLTLEAKETTLGALTAADICTYVKIAGLTVTEVYDNNGAWSSPNLTVEDADGNLAKIYKAVVEKDGDAWAIKVGDKLDVVAAVGINNSEIRLRTTNVSDITVIVEDNTGDEGNTGDEEATGRTVHYVNAYDWTATSIYAFVSADTTKNVNEITGQKNGTFEYFTYIVLDQNADGNYEVTAVYAPAADNAGDTVELQSGRIVLMMHDSCADKASYGFFTALTEGTVLSANATWDEMAATWGAKDVDFTVVEDDTTDDDTTDDGTTDDGTTEDGTTDEEIKDTGDNFVPMFVVLFAGLALVVVAVVGKRRMA